jgi:hypothetical protein
MANVTVCDSCDERLAVNENKFTIRIDNSRQWEELVAENDMCPHGVWPHDECVECGPFQGRVYLARCFLCDALTWHGLEDQRCLRCGTLGSPPTDDGTVAR